MQNLYLMRKQKSESSKMAKMWMRNPKKWQKKEDKINPENPEFHRN